MGALCSSNCCNSSSGEQAATVITASPRAATAPVTNVTSGPSQSINDEKTAVAGSDVTVRNDRYDDADIFLSRQEGIEKSQELSALCKEIGAKIRNNGHSLPIPTTNLNINDTWSDAVRGCDALLSSLYVALAKSKSESIQKAMIYSNTYQYGAECDDTKEELTERELANQAKFLQQFENIYLCRNSTPATPAVTSVSNIYEIEHLPERKEDINFSGTYVNCSFMKRKLSNECNIYVNWDDLRNGGLRGQYRTMFITDAMHILVVLKEKLCRRRYVNVSFEMLAEWKNKNIKLRTIATLHSDEVKRAKAKKEVQMQEAREREQKSWEQLQNKQQHQSRQRKDNEDNKDNEESKNNNDDEDSYKINVTLTNWEDNNNNSGADNNINGVNASESPAVIQDPHERLEGELWGNAYVVRHGDAEEGYYGMQSGDTFWEKLRDTLDGIYKCPEPDENTKIKNAKHVPKIRQINDQLFACIHVNEDLINQLNNPDNQENYLYLITLFEAVFAHEIYGHLKRKIDFGQNDKTPEHHAESGFVVDFYDKRGGVRLLKTKVIYDGPLIRVYQYPEKVGSSPEIQKLKEKEDNNSQDVYIESEIFNYACQCLTLACENKVDEISKMKFPEPVRRPKQDVANLWIDTKDIQFGPKETRPPYLETSYSARRKSDIPFWGFCLESFDHINSIIEYR